MEREGLTFISGAGDKFSVGIQNKGKNKKCVLEAGEEVTSVVFTWETELRTMIFKTNKFGSRTGTNSEEVFIPEGERLAGLKGTYGENILPSSTDDPHQNITYHLLYSSKLSLVFLKIDEFITCLMLQTEG